MGQRVVILGASLNPDRYAYMAQKDLIEKGHDVVLVSPRYDSVDGLKCLDTISEVTGPVDTLTLYVNAEKSSSMCDQIIALKPGRVIFNPGTENPLLMKELDKAAIPSLEACTLVLLSLNRF